MPRGGAWDRKAADGVWETLILYETYFMWNMDQGEHGRDGLLKNAIESGKAILAVSPLPELCRR